MTDIRPDIDPVQELYEMLHAQYANLVRRAVQDDILAKVGVSGGTDWHDNTLTPWAHLSWGERDILHANAFLTQLVYASEEIIVCKQHGYPWDHALTEPFWALDQGNDFVGARRGLSWAKDPVTGEGRWD